MSTIIQFPLPYSQCNLTTKLRIPNIYDSLHKCMLDGVFLNLNLFCPTSLHLICGGKCDGFSGKYIQCIAPVYVNSDIGLYVIIILSIRYIKVIVKVSLIVHYNKFIRQIEKLRLSLTRGALSMKNKM